MKQKKLLAVAALLSMSAFGFGDAHAVVANASAQISNDIVITTVSTPLNFGVVIPGSTAGTVTVAPGTDVGTAPTITGTDLTMSSTSACSPGHFAVKGNSGGSYVITLPDDDDCTLTHATVSGSGTTMTVVDFLHSYGASQPSLDGNGAGAFSVGATLNVAVGQVAGTYNGQYAVTVAYGTIGG